MGYWFHRKCYKIKEAVSFEQLIEYEWNFVGIQMSVRAFYDDLIKLIVFVVQKLLYYQVTANIA